MVTTNAATEAKARKVSTGTLRDLVETSWRRYGQRPALRGWVGGAHRTLTYGELALAVERFSAGLIRMGLRPGDRVAVVAENGPEWVISWLGVAMAGGVGVPISWNLGTTEVASLLRQSGARFAAAGAAQVSKVDVQSVERVIVLGPTRKGSAGPSEALSVLGSRGIGFVEVGAAPDAAERPVLAVELRPEDLATIVYTSGTTGAPKGVMLSHANLVADATAAARAISASPDDRLMLVLPLYHSFSLSCGLVTPLLAGVEIVFENDLRRIAQRMADVHPTIFLGVPALYETMYRTFVSRLESEGKLATFRTAERLSAEIKRRTGVNLGRIIFRELHQKLGGHLRFLATGGAAASPDLIREYLNLGLFLVQGWGLAETTSVATAQPLSKSRFLFTKYYEQMAGSVGRPVMGVELRLTDVPDKQIYVDTQGEGEILVRGPTVMQGYYENEEATRAVLQDGWLRTGDVGRIDRAGNVYITGRAKSVIVLESGEKVYPDEVEEYFAESPLARDICVLGRASDQKKTAVCAVIYPDPIILRQRSQQSEIPLTAETVRQWVEEEVNRVQADIAPFKRISQVILADAPLPRTELRKVRRGLVNGECTFDLERLLVGGDVAS